MCRRLWVVQEASLALQNTCFWGGSAFPLEDALLLAFVYSSASSSPVPLSDGILGAALMWWLVSRDYGLKGSPPVAIGTLCTLSTYLSATDPRDHVFALTELFRMNDPRGEAHKLLNPDYNKSRVDVFRDATRYALGFKSSGGCILDWINHRSERDLMAGGKVSWMFEWDRLADDPDLDAQILQTSGEHQLYHGDYLTIADPTNMAILTLKGVLVGNVGWSLLLTSNFLQLCAAVQQLIRLVLTISQEEYIGNGYAASARVLTAGSLGRHWYSFRDVQEQTGGATRHDTPYPGNRVASSTVRQPSQRYQFSSAL